MSDKVHEEAMLFTAVMALVQGRGGYDRGRDAVEHGALSVELIRDVIWVEGTWARLERYVKDMRSAMGEDSLYENLEALAKQA